jgi:hypothetical protein
MIEHKKKFCSSVLENTTSQVGSELRGHGPKAQSWCCPLGLAGCHFSIASWSHSERWPGEAAPHRRQQCGAAQTWVQISALTSMSHMT